MKLNCKMNLSGTTLQEDMNASPGGDGEGLSFLRVPTANALVNVCTPPYGYPKP